MTTEIECACISDFGDSKSFHCSNPTCGGDTLQVFVIDHEDFGNWCNVPTLFRDGDTLLIDDYYEEAEAPEQA